LVRSGDVSVPDGRRETAHGAPTRWGAAGRLTDSFIISIRRIMFAKGFIKIFSHFGIMRTINARHFFDHFVFHPAGGL
jgi:hypothetical protein